MVAAVKTIQIELVFRACSDLTRVRIMNLLRAGELCVCDLKDILGLPQSTTSRHLAYLRKANLVLARKEGLWMYYRLAPGRNAFHEALLHCLSKAEREVPDLMEDTKHLAAIHRNGRCCT